jgi:hypothetical protein
MTLTGLMLIKNAYLDNVEKRGQIINPNHPKTVTMPGHSTST